MIEGEARFPGGTPLMRALTMQRSINADRGPVYLVTSVMNHKRLSDARIAAVYRKRWGIEVYQPECTSSARLYQLAA